MHACDAGKMHISDAGLGNEAKTPRSGDTSKMPIKQSANQNTA